MDWITVRDVNCYQDVDTSVWADSGVNNICQLLLRDVYTIIMINKKFDIVEK